MKRVSLYFTAIVLLCSLDAATQNKTWVGGTIGNFIIPSNWNPIGVPGPTDTVIVNTNSTIDVSSISQYIASLRILNNSTVTITAAFADLAIHNPDPNSIAFLVDDGCVLTFTGSCFLYTYGVGIVNNSYIKGNLVFGGTQTYWWFRGNQPIDTTNAIISGTVSIASSNSVSNPLIYATPSTCKFLNGSLLNWQRNGGDVPSADYQDGSIINVTGVNSLMLSFNKNDPSTGQLIPYNGQIIWNCSTQTVSAGAAALFATPSFTIDSLQVVTTGIGTLRLATNPSGYLVKNLFVNGGTVELGSPTGSAAYVGNFTNIVQTGGTIIGNAFSSAAGDNAFSADTIKVSNNFIQTASGLFNFSNRTPANLSPDASCFLKVSNKVSLSGTVNLSQPATAQNCALEFNGTAQQDFNVPGTFSGKIKTVINNSSATDGVNMLTGITLPDSLVFKKGFLFLNDNDVKVSLLIQPGTTGFGKHIVTNGTGLFIIKNIATTLAIFPVGRLTSQYNPITLSLPSGSLDIGVKVDSGLAPTVLFPGNAVNRVWHILPYGTMPSALNTIFYYYNGDANPGFNYGALNQVGFHDGVVWNILPPVTGILPGGVNPYSVPIDIQSSLFNPFSLHPFAIGNLGSIVALQSSISLSAKKENDKASLFWKINNADAVAKFEIQYATSVGNYIGIAVVYPSGLNDYQFNNASLSAGINYYRIKMTAKNGSVSYSNISTLLNNEDGIKLVSLMPALVETNTVVLINAANPKKVQFFVTDFAGRKVQQLAASLTKGENHIELDFKNLPAGAYQLICVANGGKQVLRFVKQ